MPKFEVTICAETFTTYVVDAECEDDASDSAQQGEYLFIDDVTVKDSEVIHVKPHDGDDPLSHSVEQAVEQILDRLPDGCHEVMASSQYRMGFLLTRNNEIVFRDDGLSHEFRKLLAHLVNGRLNDGS